MYHRLVSSKPRLNSRKNQPSAKSNACVSQSCLASCGLSSSADSAGLSVSELNAESSVENAIVSANC